MAEKDITSAHIETFGHDKQTQRLEAATQRTHITNDIPLQEALDNHLDEDPKRLRKVIRKVDLRLTLVLAVLYTFAFIDRGNLGNVRLMELLSGFKLISLMYRRTLRVWAMP